ncbi:hypothetical protein EBU71_17920, partial [bacterium]|nr:hypothetical protein [Candidatus Elulimicrobium humile]
INLCKEENKQISKEDVASIQTQGWVNFIDNHLSGYISYLNREKDKSQFAQVKNVPHYLNVDAKLLRTIATTCKLKAGTPLKGQTATKKRSAKSKTSTSVFADDEDDVKLANLSSYRKIIM